MIDEKETEKLVAIVRSEIDLSSDPGEEEVKVLIAQTVYRETFENNYSYKDRDNLVKIIFDSIRKLDVLQELIEDEEISEIMVNGYDRIFVEKRGSIFEWPKKFASKEKLDDVIQQIVSSCNRVVNESEPIVDARLPDGERVNIVLSPPAVIGPIMTIRRFPKEVFTMEKLVENGSITEEAAEFLKAAVRSGYNCFVSGGTSSGKTTLLNVLSEFIPRGERVITIEDSAELQIKSVENLVRLETRNSNSSGCEAITIKDLIKTALRMRPDWVIVGEVRGAEVADMLQAMNTGHFSMSTGHANSSKDMITRLEAMYLQNAEIPLESIRRQIASGIDIMIHLERGANGLRRVTEISEVTSEADKSIVLRKLFDTEMVGTKYVLKKVGDLKDTYKMEKRNEI
ncbi:MAG: CpaF family protein [Lachnospiraceae bacterium]|nr:CpaF family protein [Lachnospiraceae bacterium]MBR4413577.1 CpaF family protein [Lachnospiraceae bacterium]MBR5067687.1 CpaF family protein [Lachnospiraceae bacterium]MBR5917311.1 CpaF family protein [Lachnospiraceae bacterium]